MVYIILYTQMFIFILKFMFNWVFYILLCWAPLFLFEAGFLSRLHWRRFISHTTCFAWCDFFQRWYKPFLVIRQKRNPGPAQYFSQLFNELEKIAVPRSSHSLWVMNFTHLLNRKTAKRQNYRSTENYCVYYMPCPASQSFPVEKNSNKDECLFFRNSRHVVISSFILQSGISEREKSCFILCVPRLPGNMCRLSETIRSGSSVSEQL